MSVSDYFDVFPSQDDEDFTLEVSSKQEFRELSHSGFTSGLYNNQELVVRMMKPGTGIHSIFLDSYMGTGKTRTGLTIIENWRSTMKNLPILLSPGVTIEAVHLDEIKAMFGNLTKTEINRRYNIQHYSAFANNLSSMFTSPNGEKRIIEQYGHSVIFADEIHTLRSSHQIKDTYKIFKRFFHLISDTSIILLATGTAMMDNAAEINLMNLILPSNKQMKNKDVIQFTQSANNPQELMPFFSKYFSGYLLYFNLDTSSIPPIEYIGEKYTLEDGNTTTSPVITHNMGEYQLSVYLEEIARWQKSTHKITNKIQYALNFVFPNENNEDPLNFDQHAKSYLSDTNSSTIGEFIDREWASSLKDLKVVRDFSIKYANIIEDIMNTKTIVRFVYIPWVNMGVVVFGILLETMGYRYYNGSYPIIPGVTSMDKRYAVIAEGTTTKQISNILHATNMIENKYGNYLQVIVGSPKSGEGISITNARHVDITQHDWHRSGVQQVMHRIIRINSLNYFDKNNTDEYKIVVAMHATTSEEDRFTKDIELFFLSDLKYKQISFVVECEKNLAINTSLSSYRNKNIPDSKYEELKVDYTSFVNDGYSKNVEEEIILSIKQSFTSIDSFDLESPIFSMYPIFIVRKVLFDSINNNTMFRNRWGKQCFLRYDNNVFYLQYNIDRNTTIDLFYTNQSNASIFEFIRKNLLESFIQFVDDNIDVPKSKFMKRYLRQNIEFKIVSLEAILVDRKLIPNKIRNNILEFMKNNWFLLSNCVVHVLEQINIDRVHYTANVSKLQSNGKIRIYCFNEEAPSWRLATEQEEGFILEYINSARLQNENNYSERSEIYGILNTTDNLFRIRDSSREGKGESKKKPKGFICVDSKKDTIIRYLWTYDIQPPEILLDKYGSDKLKDMKRYIAKMDIKLINPSNEMIQFFYVWLHANMKKDICKGLKNYFIDKNLLFIK
jgi:uncharacterized membrane protein